MKVNANELYFLSVPICMPPDNADFTGRMATVSGWGRLKYAGGVPSVLQEVQVNLLLQNVEIRFCSFIILSISI